MHSKEVKPAIKEAVQHFHRRPNKEIPTSKQVHQRLINEIKTYLLLKANKSSTLSHLLFRLRLKKKGEDIELLDHIIVAKGTHISLREQKLI